MLTVCRLSNYPIRELGADLMPINMASACVISYLEKRILLTVHHATGNNGNWVIELEYDPSKSATKIHQLGGMYFLKSINLSTSKTFDVDFSFIEIPDTIEAYHQNINYQTNQVNWSQKRLIGNPYFDEDPRTDTKYCFSGWIRGNKKDDKLLSENIEYNDLEYIKTEDGYHLFKLPFTHPGHDAFKGCSGAPIMDEDGNIVALVCKGDISTNMVYGISLKRYKIAIDATYGI